MILDEIIKSALKEDIKDGDHTTMSTVSKNTIGEMQLIVKEDGVLAGVDVAKEIFKIHDKDVSFRILKNDGEKVLKDDIAFEVKGYVWSLLSAERVMLNFMQRMSGIATHTSRLVSLVEDLPTKILDTRKTTPQFRLLEKMAVSIGGGYNHRFGLYDMILIKDNHVDFSGGINFALNNVFSYLEKNNLNLDVEIEVRNIKELNEVIDYGRVKRVMFDNFSVEQMKQAVQIVDGKYETEASGMINEKNIRVYAETGVDFISIGALTHQIRSLDLSFKAIK